MFSVVSKTHFDLASTVYYNHSNALPSALGCIPLLGDNGPEVSVEDNAGKEGGGTIYTKRKRDVNKHSISLTGKTTENQPREPGNTTEHTQTQQPEAR